MARVRDGSKTVFLVVDVQVGVMRGTWNAPKVIENIVLSVQEARRLGIPVIWVQHADEELIEGSPEWQLVPELSPLAGELRIRKRFNSCFEDFNLMTSI